MLTPLGEALIADRSSALGSSPGAKQVFYGVALLVDRRVRCRTASGRGWRAARARAERAVTALLEVDGVTKRFRGLRAVDDVSFAVAAGAIVALIGPNGAGKTTLFNLIAGVLRARRRHDRFAGQRIDGLRPTQVCAPASAAPSRSSGRSRADGADNVMVGALLRRAATSPRRASTRATCCDRLGLGDKRAMRASALTLPDRKRLEVARALATEPRLLLLDEVMAGPAPDRDRPHGRDPSASSTARPASPSC